MGDRCFVSIRCKAEDAGIFKEKLGVQTDGNADGPIVTLSGDHINYGGYDQIREIAEQGVTFLYQNGAGDNYGPSLIAAHQGKYEQVDCLYDSQYPAVEITSSKSPINETELRQAYRYIKLKELVEKTFGT